MTSPEPERRISVWSVPEDWRRLYFVIFSVQTLALVGLAIWYEVFVVTGDSWPETIFAIGNRAGPGIGVIAADSIVLTEVYFVVIFGGMVERYQNRLKQREARGQARERERWEAWNERRLEAEANGQPFDEPPPSAQKTEEEPEGG